MTAGQWSRVLVLAGVASCGGGGGAVNRNTSPNSDTHVTYFPISSTTVHANIDCNACHGEFDTFAQFNCMNGCHAQAETDNIHTSVSNYSYVATACYACHPTGAGIDHEKIFPIAKGTKHQNVPCTTCHIDPNNRKNFTCMNATCHPQPKTDSSHSDVGGYMYIAQNCFGCHFRGVVK